MEDSQRGAEIKKLDRSKDTIKRSFSEKNFGPTGEDDETFSRRQYGKRKGSLEIGEGDIAIESFLEINSKLKLSI